MRLAVQDGEIKVPYDLVWRLVFNNEFDKAAGELNLDEMQSLITSIKLFKDTEKLVKLYGVPDGYGISKHGIIPPQKTRRKAWVKMRRDLLIYRDKLLNIPTREIYGKVVKEFKEDLDFGNIKKIASDVRTRKLGKPKVE